MSKNFDSACFKCVEEIQKTNKVGIATNILAKKMQQGIANQDLDNIHLCSRHSR